MAVSSVECPRCGWNRATTAEGVRIRPHAVHEPPVSTDEISLLEDQVRLLDEEIFRLNENRAAILRRINVARSATRHLPPEVLSTIFQFVPPPMNFIPPFASDDFKKGDQPYIYDEIYQCDVAAVSHAWRQTAISTPQLWSSLPLGIHPSFIPACLSLLHQFSQKVPRHLMSIELDFRDQEIPWPDDYGECLDLMEPVKNVVFGEYADRIQRLRLISPPHEWLPQLKNLSRCDTLMVGLPSQYHNQVSVDLTELPLRHVILVHSGPWYTYLLPRSNLTTLHFFGVSCIMGMELLINCPNLVEFESYSPSCSRAHVATTAVNGPITLGQLEYFTWSNVFCDCRPFIHRCIGCIRFSKLRVLQWYGDNCCYSPSEGRDPRLDFFSNLPTTLSSLTFHRFLYGLQESILKTLLYSIPHVRELCFIDCNSQCVENVINSIGRPFLLDVDQREASPGFPRPLGQTFLPHLSKLSMNAFVKTLDGVVLVDMLEALRTSGKDPKQFHLVLHTRFSWDPDLQSRLQTLIEFGFSVEGV